MDQRITLKDVSEYLPRHGALAVAAIEPLTPTPGDATVEARQGASVARDTVIRAVTAYFLIQFLLLQANRLVSVPPAPRVDAIEVFGTKSPLHAA